jgi:hypothetical protein
MNYFKYEPVAQEAAIPPDKLEIIRRRFELDYPEDPMLAELHILRACRIVRDGRGSLAEIVAECEEAILAEMHK